MAGRTKPADFIAYNGVGDRPTPSTDQLLAVRAIGYTDPSATSNFVADTRGTATYKYYVAPNSVVVGSRTKQTQVRLGAKRRAVSNPVYECTGDFYDMRAAVDAGEVRVFGVAYDGVGVGPAQSAITHADAVARFAVIFSGTATVSSPRTNALGDVSFGYGDAHIGDIVLTNIFDEPHFNFRGDPESHRPFGIGVVDRNTFVQYIRDPTQANGRAVLIDAFGPGSRAVDDNPDAAQVIRRIASSMLGYVLDTAGDYRCELRVQLALNYGYIACDRIDTTVPPEKNTSGDEESDNELYKTYISGAFVDTVAKELEAAPPAEATDGDPRGSMLGVVGSCVHANVGSIDYEEVDPKTAGEILAHANPQHVGFSSATGKIVPGTIADELLGKSVADPASADKLNTRHILSKAMKSGTLPVAINGVSTEDLLVQISPAHDTAIGTCPAAVIASHAWHTANGSAHIINPSMVHVRTAAGDELTGPAAGQRLDIYAGHPKAEDFQGQLKQAVRLAKRKRVAVHTLPDDSVARIRKAAEDVLRG